MKRNFYFATKNNIVYYSLDKDGIARKNVCDAIIVTREEWESLRFKKNPFNDYNSKDKIYNAFIVDNKRLYIRSYVCNKYRYLNRRCLICNEPKSCIEWKEYYVYNGAWINIIRVIENTLAHAKKSFITIPVDKDLNRLIIKQLKKNKII